MAIIYETFPQAIDYPMKLLYLMKQCQAHVAERDCYVASNYILMLSKTWKLELLVVTNILPKNRPSFWLLA